MSDGTNPHDSTDSTDRTTNSEAERRPDGGTAAGGDSGAERRPDGGTDRRPDGGTERRTDGGTAAGGDGGADGSEFDPTAPNTGEEFEPVDVFPDENDFDLRPGSDSCYKYSTCDTNCPVAEVDDDFPGPKF